MYLFQKRNLLASSDAVYVAVQDGYFSSMSLDSWNLTFWFMDSFVLCLCFLFYRKLIDPNHIFFIFIFSRPFKSIWLIFIFLNHWSWKIDSFAHQRKKVQLWRNFCLFVSKWVSFIPSSPSTPLLMDQNQTSFKLIWFYKISTFNTINFHYIYHPLSVGLFFVLEFNFNLEDKSPI